MVSEVLDVPDDFTNQDYSIPSGFEGPYICWAVLRISTIYEDCWILQRTLWNSGSKDIYQIYQVNSKYFNGNSDNFCSLNFSPVFPQQGGKYMNNKWNWTIGWVFHGNTCSRYPSQGTQVMLTQDKETKKVWTLQPKPSHTRGAECEEQLEEQHRQGAGVQPYPSDYITTPVAPVQHCSGRGAAQRSSKQQQQQGGWGASLWYADCIIQ